MYLYHRDLFMRPDVSGELHVFRDRAALFLQFDGKCSIFEGKNNYTWHINVAYSANKLPDERKGKSVVVDFVCNMGIQMFFFAQGPYLDVPKKMINSVSISFCFTHFFAWLYWDDASPKDPITI